jgi:hypothetical protein
MKRRRRATFSRSIHTTLIFLIVITIVEIVYGTWYVIRNFDTDNIAGSAYMTPVPRYDEWSADFGLKSFHRRAMQHDLPTAASIKNQPVSHAYFTLISSMEYVIGAQILVCKLRYYSTDIPIFVLVDESLLILDDTMAATNKTFTREKYLRIYNYFTNTLNTTVVVVPDLAVRVPQVASNTEQQQPTMMVKNEIRSKTYTKLNVWQFVNVQKIGVYFDADTIPIRNPESLLYQLEPASAIEGGQPDPHSDFGVVGYEDYFNTGVFVFRPSQHTFNALLLRLRYGNYTKDKRNPTEQDLLISHFGKQQNKSVFVSDEYNYRPLNNQAGWDLHNETVQGPAIIHYIGNPKPWTYILGKSTSIDGLFTTIHDSKRTSLPLWSIQLYQYEMEDFFTKCI